jgi:hypothetical protein
MSRYINRKDIDGLIELLANEARERYSKRISLGRETVVRTNVGEFFIIGMLNTDNQYALQQIMWHDTRENLLNIMTGSKREKYFFNPKFSRNEVDEILMRIALSLS